MQSIKVKANAKINLGLSVLGKRMDGYHELSMVNQSIDLFDEVDISLTKEGIILNSNANIPLDGRNTAYKAAQIYMEEALQRDNTLVFGVSISISKNIPIMAGVGGSSADAAAVLFGLNKLFNIFSENELWSIGARIGADVPFMICGGSMCCQGIGEKLSAVSGEFPPCNILLAKPKVGVGAGWAYAEFDRLSQFISNHENGENDELCRAINMGDIELLCKNLHNDLEIPVLKSFPEILEAKELLMQSGAKAALMSGSGSCSFGIFDIDTDMESLKNKLKDNHSDLLFFTAKADTKGCREG